MEAVGVTVVRATVVVDSDNKVVGAIVGKDGVELNPVPSLLAVYRSFVDLVQLAEGDQIAHFCTAELGLCGIAHINHAVSLGGKGIGVGVVEGYLGKVQLPDATLGGPGHQSLH